MFPRLLARSPSARDLVARLEGEHRDVFAAHWRKLRPLLAAIASGQRDTLPPDLVREVREDYASHIAAENDTLIPMCEEALTPAELVAIGAEMAARRGVAWPPPRARRARRASVPPGRFPPRRVAARPFPTKPPVAEASGCGERSRHRANAPAP